ncbi:hypothetical protein SUTMEG_12510 [Sutterella megalosphaeroides]|uniref:Bacteriophage T5 Orf172 DNA-binding domain-containing protein n=1 Tax=Sutterella megalosphaeroides TaxID=2494234 RepID=A0A2Z6IBT7_9BURK|nr:hypothetical protein SUTMEG_12510 [Sutterella megalosphaeroides]
MTPAPPSSGNDEKAGYVYILTNESFREDWIKIGKSARPVNVRSKELDNTAVPLPFSIYATIRTVKYHEVEKHVHKLIDRLTHLRIRRNREFFNVPPQLALETFRDLAAIIDDAVITLYEDNKPVREERPSQGALPGPVAPKKPSKAEPAAPESGPERSGCRASRFRFDMVGIREGGGDRFRADRSRGSCRRRQQNRILGENLHTLGLYEGFHTGRQEEPLRRLSRPALLLVSRREFAGPSSQGRGCAFVRAVTIGRPCRALSPIYFENRKLFGDSP